jgi:hypothetical protein
MPFTPAHVAAVIPFLKLDRRYVSATALVIGSMVPDFEYFFKFSVNTSFSHTIWGMFWFDVPVTLVLALLFHLIVKRNLLANLPLFLQSKFADMQELDFIAYLKTNAFVFVICALVGSATHILWDGFTHFNGYFVRLFNFYNGSYVPYDDVNYPMWYALQHASTVTGLLIVSLYIILKKPETKTSPFKPTILYWLLVILTTATVTLVRFTVRPNDYHLGNLVVSGISGFCIALLIGGLINFKNVSLKQR